MKIKQDKICGTCCAWNVPGGSLDKGECRKAPPTTLGWPKTLKRDWCIDGWLKNDIQASSINTGKVVSPLDTSSLAFNYHYLVNSPEMACQWLSTVLEQPEIPEQIIAMLKGSLAETPAMLADDCDQILTWAHNIPGFSVNDDDDESYMAIIIYTDVKSDYDQSLQWKSAATDMHPFMAMLKGRAERLMQANLN